MVCTGVYCAITDLAANWVGGTFVVGEKINWKLKTKLFGEA